MASRKDNYKFVENVISDILSDGVVLDKSIEWIADNKKPQEVYDDGALLEWATSKQPEDIFSETDLEAWAEANGFVKQ